MTPHGLGLFPFVNANPLSRSHKLEDFFQLTPHPSSRLNLTLSVASGTSEAHGLDTLGCGSIGAEVPRPPGGQRCKFHGHKPWLILDWKDLRKCNWGSDLTWNWQQLRLEIESSWSTVDRTSGESFKRPPSTAWSVTCATTPVNREPNWWLTSKKHTSEGRKITKTTNVHTVTTWHPWRSS